MMLILPFSNGMCILIPIKDPFPNRSPAQLAQDVANLQKSQVVLLETQSELKSR